MSSQNPRGKVNMRRVQAVLNARYPGECEAVEFLDRARQETDANDRALITEAILLLREKYTGEAYTPPNFRETVSLAPDSMAEFEARVTAAVTEALTRILSGLSLGSAPMTRTQIQTAARESVAAVSTANLVGKSMRYAADDEEDE